MLRGREGSLDGIGIVGHGGGPAQVALRDVDLDLRPLPERHGDPHHRAARHQQPHAPGRHHGGDLVQASLQLYV